MTTRVPRVVRDPGLWFAPEENKMWRSALAAYNYSIHPGDGGFSIGQNLSGEDIPVRINHHPSRSVCHAPGAILCDAGNPGPTYGIAGGYPAFIFEDYTSHIDLLPIYQDKFATWVVAMVFYPYYTSGSDASWISMLDGLPLAYHATVYSIGISSSFTLSISNVVRIDRVNVVVVSAKNANTSQFYVFDNYCLICNGQYTQGTPSHTSGPGNPMFMDSTYFEHPGKWALIEYSIWFPNPDADNNLDGNGLAHNYSKNIYRHFHRKYGLSGQLP